MKLERTEGEMPLVVLSVAELSALAYPAGDIHAGAYTAPRVSAAFRTRFLSECGGEDGFLADQSVTYEFDRPSVTTEENAFTSEGDVLSYRIRLLGTVDGILSREGANSTLYALLPSGGYDAGGNFRKRSRTVLRALGALYLSETGEPTVELCYVTALSTGRLLFEREEATRESLLGDLTGFLSDVLETMDFLARHRTTVVPRAGDVPFPYPSLREGQEELIRTVYRTIRRGRRLFAEAPTGIGKTMSTLYPAVKALGNGHVDKIFYLTAKASTGREAFQAAGRLFHAGARLRTCVITAKEQVCLLDQCGKKGNRCNPFDCPYADGYYERSPSAILSLLRKQNGYTRDCILEAAREYEVCPYELSLDLSEKCDIVICDYNYVFDPAVYFRRYFGEERTYDGRYVFLVDEGHNLADRAREMYSVSLFRSSATRLLSEIPEESTVIRRALDGLLQGFEDMKALCADTLQRSGDGEETGFYMSKEAPRFFDEVLEKTVTTLKEELRALRHAPHGAAVSDFLSELRGYRMLRGYYNERFLTMVRVRDGDVEVRIFCLDPSEVLNECFSRAHASVVFSATLTPLDYFTDVLGGGKSAEHLSLPSPFPRENLCIAVADAISTRYENRANTYRSISASIAATVSQKKGNYIVYFPSYSYLEEVAKAFSARYPRVELILQTRGMGYEARERFLDSFRDDGRLRVGFCVLGGSFSEGVDLPGGRLIGTVIVGVGLPGLSEEGNILRDYYENKCERGYDYAYTFPGMNRVLQAAGRVIRTDSDRGVVVLVDDRYAGPLHRSLFPQHWEGVQYAGNAASLAEILRRFWEKT